MPPDVDSFAETLEDTLPCLFTRIASNHRSAFLAGPETRIDLQESPPRLEFSTPVEGAHDGLSAADLQDLLSFNFPNDLTRGSFLAGGRGAGNLALNASLALAETTAEEACDAIFDQIAAALALGERIAQRRAGTFSQGSLNDAS